MKVHLLQEQAVQQDHREVREVLAFSVSAPDAWEGRSPALPIVLRSYAVRKAALAAGRFQGEFHERPEGLAT